MSRVRHSALLGWHKHETYEGIYEALCWRYHPAVAAILAHEFLAASAASVKAADTVRRRQQVAA